VVDKPLVSVAIITYNQQEYLEACIESVLKQEYENIEIVIADDASTDGTQDMLREYDAKFPGKFILKLSDENGGITKNSNLAHFSCSGKYIAWMGGDDLMLPEKILKQVEYMENNPKCTISYHNLDVFDSATGKTLYEFNGVIKPRQGKVDIAIKYGAFNGACSSMVRRDKTPASGFNEQIPVTSDWLFWIECLVNGGDISYLPEILGRYRRHENNITSKFDDDYREQFLTLNIVESQYPWLCSSVSAGRGHIYYSMGVANILNGKYQQGRLRLLQGVKQSRHSWKWFSWWCYSWLKQSGVIH